jgi:phage baseplate assembly protein W
MPYKNIEINNIESVYQQPPKTSHFYKGFSSVNVINAGSQLYDFDLIKQDLLNHFNTRKGERLMNPSFGSIIWDVLMEPLTDEIRDILNQDITSICNSDPRVIPTQIDLTEYELGYVLEITLLLKNTDQSATMRLIFDQKIGLIVQ